MKMPTSDWLLAHHTWLSAALGRVSAMIELGEFFLRYSGSHQFRAGITQILGSAVNFRPIGKSAIQSKKGCQTLCPCCLSRPWKSIVIARVLSGRNVTLSPQ